MGVPHISQSTTSQNVLNSLQQRTRQRDGGREGGGEKRCVFVKAVICIILHITFTSVYETQLNSRRPQSYIFRSLPQLSEPQHKMNWHKCLWKWNIRLKGSMPSTALYGNGTVLKSASSHSEVEQLIDCSHGMEVI